MTELYDRVQDMLEQEIEKIVTNGQLTQTSLCNLDTLVDIVKDIKEIKDDHDYAYSGRRGSMMYNDGYGHNGSENFNRGSSYDNKYDSRYDERGRDGYMRYEGDLHYSGTGSKEHMISLMKDAMAQATTQEEHDEIMKMIKKMESK